MEIAVSLLHQIQEAVIDPGSGLGPILLKLRLLADRLGSDQLEEWVKHESEGYPQGVDVPTYRRVKVLYTGNFQNIAWKVENQPIPPRLIQEFCGDAWNTFNMRESISAIEDLIRNSDEGGSAGIDASDLILALQGKVMPDMNCSSVIGKFSPTAVGEIQNTVRTRVLELTMKLEKEVPGASEITIGSPLKSAEDISKKIEQVVNTTVYGPNTTIVSAGAQANITVNNAQGDMNSIVSELINGGVPKSAAEEFSQIIADEQPDGPGKPFGKNAGEWLGVALPKIAKGAWGIGVSMATHLLEEAAKKYYGID